MPSLNPIVAGDFKHRTAYSCQRYPEFCYHVYVPWDPAEPGPPGEDYTVLALIHGSERGAESYRNSFIRHGAKNRQVILAPLFPCGLGHPGLIDNYVLLRCGQYAFDEVLLAMLDEVAQRFTVPVDTFDLHGFSGGGQFVHRFFYLHPERLNKLSIGAPGSATYPDCSRLWPEGLKDTEELFGKTADFDAMRKVNIQIVVGDEDVTPCPGHDAAANRFERCQALHASYRKMGFNTAFDAVPGAGHNGFHILEPVYSFFSRQV